MALYHKHRPQLWHSVIGQDIITETIQNQIIMGKPAHAYLLSGPRGVGKTTTARLIAKAVNCPNRKETTAEPCNDCASCKDITAGSALDVIEIDAASHTGVDTVRETIIENAQSKPTHSPYKVFIIDEVHMLSTSAFNALLKTLEEPPAYALFILATTELGKLPATIISRCQRFTFKKIPREKMLTVLKGIAKEENIEIDEEVLARVIKKSEGAARDAISLLDQLMATTGTTITLTDADLLLPATNLETQLAFLKAITDKNILAGYTIINRTVESGLSLNQFMGDLIDLLRYLLISQSDPQLAKNELQLSGTLLDEFNILLKKFTSADLIMLLDRAFKRNQDLKNATIPQLPLELFLVESTLSTPEPSSSIPQKTKEEQRKEHAKVPIEHQEASKNIDRVNIVDQKKDTDPVQEIVSPTPIKAHQTPDQKKQDSSLLNRAEVERAWPEFMRLLETTNPSLVFLLKMAELKNIDEEGIHLLVRYSFHQEKLNEPTSKHNLEELLGKCLNTKVRIIINLDETSHPAATNELHDLAAAFGGEVV